MPASRSLTDNHRGILYMVAASTGFIVNDTFVKLASEDMSIAQIIVLRSFIALPLVILLAVQQGAFRGFRLKGSRFLWWRTLGEIACTGLYLTALANMDIANSTAIMQTVPLATTAAAALLLGERVGIRRWSAILVGLAAVLLIVRPGMQGFNGWSVLALASVAFVVLRDLCSRMMPISLHPLTVAAVSLVALIGLGFAMLPFGHWAPLTLSSLLYCLGSGLVLTASFLFIVMAMRHGEIAVVSPFRYTIMLWAILIQIVVFSVWPDIPTLVGSAMLVATGLYTLYRERQVKSGLAPAARSQPTATAPSPR